MPPRAWSGSSKQLQLAERWKLGRRTRKAWTLPNSSVGEDDGIGRHSQEPQRYRYQVWWRLDDGTQGSKTFDSRGLARDFENELLAQAAANT